MKMALDSSINVNSIRSYATGRVTIRDREFEQSLIVWPTRIKEDWAPETVEQLRAGDLKPLLDDPPEVLILGTGDRQVFPPASTFATMMDMGIGFEVMDNAAACRTYNILLAEQRRVAVALLISVG
jgi:uncharacterized protein